MKTFYVYELHGDQLTYVFHIFADSWARAREGCMGVPEYKRAGLVDPMDRRLVVSTFPPTPALRDHRSR